MKLHESVRDNRARFKINYEMTNIHPGWNTYNNVKM